MSPVRFSFVTRTALLFAVAAAMSASLGAQTTTGSIRGYVRDPAGQPMADVQLSARSVDMGLMRGTATNASGFYYIPGFAPAPTR